jgi:transcriptional regulator with XRE-family HTH domain
MTPFGQKLRSLRAERRVSMKTMAHALGVSASYLSALEHGRRGPPPFHLVQRTLQYFNIIWDDAEELQRLADLSNPRVSVDTAGLTPVHTRLANLMAEEVARLSEDDAQALLTLLEQLADQARTR